MAETNDRDVDCWISRLQMLPEFECGKPARWRDIANAQSQLAVRFPVEYEHFLRKFGFASWFGSEIFGISEDPYFDVLTATLEARNEPLPSNFLPFPSTSVVLSRDGEGGYYLLDCEAAKQHSVRLITVESRFKTEDRWENIKEFVVESYFTELDG